MRRRRVAALIALCAFAFWPLVHIELVSRFAIDPWRFGGWAMYVVPKRPPEVTIAVVDRLGWRLVDPARGSLQLARELNRFKRQQEAWPHMGGASRLMERVLAENPAALEVRVRLRRFRLAGDARVRYETLEFKEARSR